MKRVRPYSAVLLTAALAITTAVGTAAFADDSNSTTTTNGTTATATVTTPKGSPATVSGRVGGLNFAQKSFWVDVDGNPVSVDIGDAKIQYQGQDANLYRLFGSPKVDVSGTITGGTTTAPGGVLHADTINITSGPTVRLQRSSYTDQAQPPFGANDLQAGTSGAATTPVSTSSGHTTNGGTMESHKTHATSGSSHHKKYYRHK